MGGGTSLIPNKLDKETFKAIVQGALSEQIFEEYSVDGVLTTERLAELSRAIARFASNSNPAEKYNTQEDSKEADKNSIPSPPPSQQQPSRFLHIVHFNDLYNLDMSYEEEPRGGARKFASQVKAYRQELAGGGFGRPLVLFSGDFVGPSLMSSLTQGAHIIGALNAIGVDYATFGNHELDYGYESLKSRLQGVDDDLFDEEVGFEDYEVSETQWLSSNLTEAATGLPMGGARVRRHALVHWETGQGGTHVKVGLLAVSENWLTSCSQLPSGVLQYEDYITAARRTARFLRESGAEVVLAITHNRLSNDVALTQAVPEIDLLLGGHDHFYRSALEHRVVKSGEEWRWLSKVRIEVRAAQPPLVSLDTVEVRSTLPDDIQITALCDKFALLCQKKFRRKIFESAAELLPVEEVVRFRESALCNWICDVCVEDYSLQDGLQAADLCLLLGYNFAGKAAIPAGDFTLAHLFSIFPLPLTMAVVRISGQNVLDSLTEGCQDLPAECGAIHHVSADLSYVIQIDKQGRQKPRVAQARFRGQPLELERYYTVCLPTSLCTGKYGYKWNVTAEKVVEEEFAPQLQDLVTMYCKRHWKSTVPNKFPANPSMGRIKIEYYNNDDGKK